MKNYELIKLLQELPAYLEVVSAIDDEGNGFRGIPDGWVSVEKFTIDNGIVAEEDYEEYDSNELYDMICIG